MLLSFLARMTALVQRRARPAERRKAKRLAPGQATPCTLAVPGGQPSGGWVHNISVKGVGLLADQEHRPGTLLRVLIVNAAHVYALSVEVEVVRCFRLVTGEHFIGGQFRRALSPDELGPFML
jgi:PilZ domain-containing protein